MGIKCVATERWIYGHKLLFVSVENNVTCECVISNIGRSFRAVILSRQLMEDGGSRYKKAAPAC